MDPIAADPIATLVQVFGLAWNDTDRIGVEDMDASDVPHAELPRRVVLALGPAFISVAPNSGGSGVPQSGKTPELTIFAGIPRIEEPRVH